MTAEPTAAEIEAAARAVYEVEYPCYDPAAHPDHNRWSWVGDGNSEVVKDGYRAYAKAALTAVLPDHDARLRERIEGETVDPRQQGAGGVIARLPAAKYVVVRTADGWDVWSKLDESFA